MTSWYLFRKRWWMECKFQYKVIRPVLDWTVLLYIVLPAIVIAGFIYRSWWSEIPSWMTYVTPWTMFLVSYLFSWYGEYRNYIQEADQVFLTKHVHTFIGMKRWAYIYSIFIRILAWIVICFILLPTFNLNLAVSDFQIFVFFLFFLSLNLFFMSLKMSLDRIKSKWINTVVYILLLILFGYYVYVINLFWSSGNMVVLFGAITIHLLISVFIYQPYVKNQRYFWTELTKEQKAHAKYTQLIFGVSLDLEKVKIKTRSKPRLFRKSSPIYKNRNALNGWKTLFLKAFLRDSANWSGYLRIISIITGAIAFLLPNLVLKAVFLFVLFFILSVWLPLLWDHITLSHPIGKASKQANEDDFYLAKKQMISMLTVIGMMIAIIGWGIGFLVNF